MYQRLNLHATGNSKTMITLLVMWLGIFTAVHAAEISTGTVIDVRGDTVSIELVSGPAPAIGDIAELSFELGGEQFVIGTWQVTKLLGPVVEAGKVKADLAPDKGVTVRFSSAAKDTVPAASPAAPSKTTEAGSSQPATVATTTVQFVTTSEYQSIWKDIGSGAELDFAVWRPLAKNGFYPLGDVANAGPWPGERYGKPPFGTLLIKGGKPPVGYRKIWSSKGSFSDNPFSSWVPVAPQGYKCLGDVGSVSLDQMPSTDAIRCVPENCAIETPIDNVIWKDKGSGAELDFSAWLIPKVNTYVGTAAHERPRGVFYTINDACR